VGINSLKTLKNGRVQIETSSKKEIEILTRDINEKCGGELEANVHTLRNPNLVIYIPEDISKLNIEDTLLSQNPELNLKTGDIKAKFSYGTKRRTRNLLIEVSAQTRKQLIQKRIKQGWLICGIGDYIVVNRCFNAPKSTTDLGNAEERSHAHFAQKVTH
jgi:23S rRNA A1618 N6-methylase RlmF